LPSFNAFYKLLALSVVLTLALASAAFADDMTNLLDNSPDTPIGTFLPERHARLHAGA
jgi:hypothetical protein